jgi:hypothetical protein
MNVARIEPNFSSIPPELRRVPRWVTWRLEGKPGKPKPDKVPYRADLPHSRASSTDPETWCSFEQAEAAYLEGDRAGVGLVLDGTDQLAGVDIDGCRNPQTGEVDPAALALLDRLGAGYVEVSPSGTGLRAFGYAPPLESGAVGTIDGLKVELYSKGRYLTLTGQALKSGPLVPLRGFGDVAEAIRPGRRINAETGEIERLATDQRHGELVRRVLSGDVYHDSLRDLAASLVASGMHGGAVVNHLRGLMDASAAPHDDRWKARRQQIPELVTSAAAKFAPAPSGAGEGPAEDEASNEPRFSLLTADGLRGLPPLAWCVRGVLPVAGVSACYGPSGAGKSFLVLDLLAAIGEGRPWFGRRVKQTPVVYCALEGEAGIRQRVEAWERANDRPFPAGVRMILQPFKLTEPGDVEDLAAAVTQGLGPGAVTVLDTLNRAAPGLDENSSADMGRILEAVKRLQQLTGGAVLLVHHSGKDLTKGLRGHSSLYAALDTAIEVTREGDRRRWRMEKAKDGEDGEGEAFRLSVVDLGTDDEGEPQTSCVVEPDESAERGPRLALPQGGNQKVVLNALREMVGKVSTFGMHGAPNHVPCVQTEHAVEWIAPRLTCEPGRKKERTRQALTGLINAGVVVSREGWLWLR